MCKYLVSVINERFVCCTMEAESFEDGIKLANKLLKDHLVELTGGCPEDVKKELYGEATSESPTAWCDYLSKWDAHVSLHVEKEEPKSTDYQLYGVSLIRNDATLKDFCHSLFEKTPCDKTHSLQQVVKMVDVQLKYDLPRTNINYEALLSKYVSDIGGVLLEMDANKCPMPELSFKGPKAKDFFNEVVSKYIQFHLLSLLDLEGNVVRWTLEEDAA